MITDTPIIIPTYEPDENFVSFIKGLRSEVSAPIIVVDDGSGLDYRAIFDFVENEYKIELLRHAENLGKGRSLKTAFNYILNNYSDVIGVITVDSDGQHLIGDIKNVSSALVDNPDDLIMGCRNFNESTVPWKSKIGNSVTIKILGYLCGVHVSDTQTGLRGIPLKFLKVLMHTPGERFEYETNMLLECNDEMHITEVPITTVYDSKDNHKTHFNPLRDSLTIYKVILAYSLSSVLATIIDFTVFSIMTWVGCGIWLSTAFARILAALANFILNKKVVFKSKNNGLRQLLKYAVLVIVSGTLSALSISLILKYINANLIELKVIVETILFFFNYYVQRTYIFVKRKGNEIEKSLFSDEITESTDWTKYYKGKRSFISTLTQRHTLHCIMEAMNKYVAINKKVQVCELGGGNSCFATNICEKRNIETYDIIDNNVLAVKLFGKMEIKAGTHKGICRDLLNEDACGNDKYGFVYSIGLIEHFRGDDIKKVIKRHFDYCQNDGIVLISFPTPTRKYLFIRKIMELMGVWQFHDEKPIRYDEVADCFNSYGNVLEHYINKRLPLTQEIVIIRKQGV